MKPINSNVRNAWVESLLAGLESSGLLMVSIVLSMELKSEHNLPMDYPW